MLRHRVVMVLAIVAACGGGDKDSGSGDKGSSSGDKAGGSAPAKGSADKGSAKADPPKGSADKGSADKGSADKGSAAGGSGSAAAVELKLADGESRHQPPVEIDWELKSGTVKVTLLDVKPPTPAAGPTHKLVVWGHGKQHEVLKTKFVCDKEAELWKAPNQRIVFRCGIGGKTESTAQLWQLRWKETKAYPTRARHWEGLIDEKEPKWAASPKPKTGKGRPPKKDKLCCCETPGEEGEMIFSTGTRELCRAAAGKCVADAKCAASEEGDD